MRSVLIKVTFWMFNFYGTKNGVIFGICYFSMSATANAEIVAKLPIVNIMLALKFWFTKSRNFILLIASVISQLDALILNIPQHFILR